MRLLAVGHVTRDETGGTWRPGGSAFYAAAAAAKLGLDPTLVARVGTADLETFERICASLGVRLVPLESGVTTTFTALGPRGGVMRWRLTARASEIGEEELRAALAAAGESLPARYDAIVLGTVAREIHADIFDALRGGARVLIAQGFLRQWDRLGRIGPRVWEEVDDYAQFVDAVVVSDQDLEGQPDVAASWSRSTTVVVTRGAEGAAVWRNGRAIDLPGFPRAAVDTIGAGDTFAAAFAIAVAEGRPVLDAARFACAAASFEVEGEGVSSLADRRAVEERIKSAT